MNGKAKKNVEDKGKENGKEKESTPSKSNATSYGDSKESPTDKNIKKENIESETIKKEEGEDAEEEEEAAEKDVEVSLKLNKSLTWFQAPLPPEKNSYTPVHILSRTFPVATTSPKNDSSAVKDSLDNSIDCVRNEVLEVLTKTIYSVARSLRSDPVSQIKLKSMVIF